MNKTILIICLGIMTLNAQKKEKVAIPFKGVKSNDPMVQIEIDQIREEFLQRRNTIRANYKRQIELLREQERNEIRSLKSDFLIKLKEMKRVHKDIVIPKETQEQNLRTKTKKDKKSKAFRKNK